MYILAATHVKVAAIHQIQAIVQIVLIHVQMDVKIPVKRCVVMHAHHLVQEDVVIHVLQVAHLHVDMHVHILVRAL